MTLPDTAHTLSLLASGAEGGGTSVNPYATGFGALGVLLLLLWITTRFNRDR
ncbi:hypothetical protein IQ279_13260 [Streptomyces verrucosisporus]|uniref:hypothetical protein n=1 Tax=Streptomyces verrucosisporus TaxID=1695161 RepID=UPI0019D190EC|nr:hypothetical protein [Streptomyces verrucosisporus]MBN3930590.1 hypothetical protein [Streptomyces verrucosisporus]